MTFTSYLFLLVFLPVVIGVYYALTRLFSSQNPAIVWLIAASLLFYGSLGPGYVLVLLGSVAMNYLFAIGIRRQPEASRARKVVLIGGIVANLVLLGYYKYTGFLAENINAIFGTDMTSLAAIYPVGLSFYTFIQIGFLIDMYIGQVERLSFLRYLLFGTFFPYVTAGPLVRQTEVFSQLETPVRERTGLTRLVIGSTMFFMGLFKKAVLADSVAPYVGTLFAAGPGDPVSTLNAWIGALAYTFELYFDFSGYSDMAIGLGYMIGIKLPLNFNSPLRATSLVDFWRRWHLTMVRFFTNNNIYTPLAARMMRRSIRRRYPEPVRLLLVMCFPVFVTFVLVGFWHGAGWGFIISGAIHGIGLSVNLVWRELTPRFGLPAIPSVLGWALMMVPLVASLVFLRAPNVPAALNILGAMVGIGAGQGVTPAQFYGTTSFFGLFTYVPAISWLLVLMGVALFFPKNTQQILDKYDVALPTLVSPDIPSRFQLQFRPSLRWASAIAIAAGLALIFAGGPSPFLYYIF